MHQLTDADRQILDFERLWWRQAGSKEAAIRDLFDWSATRYHQRLNWLIDQPAAEAYAPSVVHRLRRLREQRRAERRAS